VTERDLAAPRAAVRQYERQARRHQLAADDLMARGWIALAADCLKAQDWLLGAAAAERIRVLR
jgi:hypothetical protein